MKFTIENSLYTSGSLAGKAGHPLVFPMVKETIKFLDKKLGYKEKDKIHATVHDGKTFCDRYPHPNKRKDFLVVNKTDGEQTRWRKRIPNEYVMETDSEQLTDYSGEVLIQVLALTWDKEEEPIALMYFFDNRCNSVWPKVDTDEERTTLYVYSPELHREKSPSVTIKNVGMNELGWWSNNCAYATSDAKLDSDKLPSNFKSLLTTFYKKLVYTGDGIPKDKKVGDVKTEAKSKKYLVPFADIGSKKVGDSFTFTYVDGVKYTGTLKLEDDEKHSKCKVSDTADSKKVYGVFFSWDGEDDGYNDMYVAAVGTYVIRVHKDVTIESGDLLVSNGDGTAKVQDDDIIRSKTVAKVLTNIKQETYSDGSYTVPCALYCG